MKLYREVGAVKGTGLYLYKYVHDFADHKYVHALEPIEITEEEKKRMASQYSAGHYTDSDSINQAYDDYMAGIEDLLSKLKGE